MKIVIALLLPLLLASTAGAQQFQPLFNGKDLTGWEGDPRLWKVENGVLIGETNDGDKKVKANTFLIWKDGKLKDFDLRVKARVTGNNNSGIQYRSAKIGNAGWALAGYQMDMHPKQEFLGMLYEEKGRGIVCQRGKQVNLLPGNVKQPAGDFPLEKVDLSKWNEYRIVARGNTLRHFVNGKKAVQVIDRDAEKGRKEGLLGLQLHAGPGMRLEVQSIGLRELKAQPPAKPKEDAKQKQDAKPQPPAKPKAKTTAVPEWIWSRKQAGGNEKVYFRKSFDLPEADTAALLTISCDNKFEVWINGKPVGGGSAWERPEHIEVRPQVSPGKNVIAVLGENAGGIAALAASLEVQMKGGGKMPVVTDGSWKWASEGPKGWEQPGFDDAKWAPVAVHGKMGIDPWGTVFGPRKEAEPQVARDETANFKVAKGFKLEKLYDVPKAQGSWVSMAVLPDGSLVVSDQYGGLYQVQQAAIGDATAETKVTPLPLEIGGSHGMLWHRGALYVVVNERIKVKNGVYKVTDSDGDGKLDKIEQLKEIQGGGEHGLHSLVPSPDGEWIYMICGNHTTPPEMDHYWMPRNWDEDHLLPRNPDGRGHARGTMAPGGWVCRFKPDNSRWELVASGFRNPFDLAFNAHGDLFAYDADMEWDLGMPWYRPTRMCHVLPGAEFGWRNGTGKWPEYYEDSLPAVVDIGPGSPTGALSGLGARFPEKYQRAIYLFDWTFATIHAVHLGRDGSTYTGTKEEFVAGPGLPLTDAGIGKDGAMYFMTGGRRAASALWRVTYTGSESTAPVRRDDDRSAASKLVGRLGGAGIEKVAEVMGSDDRFERFMARVEAERRPIGEIVRAIGRKPTPWQAINGAMAAARQGGERERLAAGHWLGTLTWETLTKEQQLGMLRAWALVFSRMGEPSEAERKVLLGQIDAHYPAGDDELNRELCRVLCYLRAPKVVDRTLRLMAAQKDTVWPDWAELVTRNAGYGKAVLNMLRNSPPAQDIHYALCLRNVKGPWTKGQRRQIMEWYAMARSKSGGNSYGPFLDKMQKDMLANATEEERTMVAGWNLAPPKSPFENLPQPKGPGRNWTVSEVAALGSGDLSGADQENGKRMFQATLCAACHRIEGEGGGAGPDLTAVGGRFTPQDIAEAILDPSRVISDQYHFELIEKKDGSSVWGRPVDEKDGVIVVAVNAYDFSQTVEVPRSEIAKMAPSPVSPMPGALINRLNEAELKDLLAYLLRK